MSNIFTVLAGHRALKIACTAVLSAASIGSMVGCGSGMRGLIPFADNLKTTANSAAGASSNTSSRTSTIAVSMSPQTVDRYGTVRFTATVAPADATGTVQMQWFGNPLGSATIVNGQATFSRMIGWDPGKYPITANYSGDSTTAPSASGSVSLTVVPQSTPLPTAPVPGQSGLKITTSSLPSPTINTFYQTTLTATGGTPPYTWNTNSNLPGGIKLATNGTLAGTPYAAVSLPLVISATDANGSQAWTNLTLSIQQQSSPGTGQGSQITSCQALNQANTTYVLQNDVQAYGTCFGIVNDNVTLNLNGHTVTYATGDGSRANYGVLVADCWDVALAGIDQSVCGGSHMNPVIENGTITQGGAAAPMSHAIRLGLANGRVNETVHDVTINISAQDTIGIYSTFPPGGTQIYNVVVNDNVTAVSNRDEFFGYPVKMDYGGNTSGKTPQDVIHDVTCNGSPQGCIFSQGSLLAYNNHGRLGPQEYVGGYGVFLGGDNSEAYGNSFTGPTRGYEIEGSNINLHDNTADIEDSGSVHDPGHNPDGCEIDGTFGIRVKAYPPTIQPTNVTIQNNHITVTAGPCQAQGLRFTQILGSEQMSVRNNTFTEIRVGQKADNAAVSLDQSDASSISFSGNNFNSSTHDYAFFAAYDGAQNLNLTGAFTGSNVIYARCGGAPCTNLNVSGLPGTPVLECEADHQLVTVTGNGQTLTCPN